MDADKEGFLRSETSLVQMIGRTARHINAEVVLYADKMTPSMQRAIDETNRRRELQITYNQEHNIEPETIKKAIRNALQQEISGRRTARQAVRASETEYDRTELITTIEKEMLEAAEKLDFERAAMLRDRLRELQDAPSLTKTTDGPPGSAPQTHETGSHDDGNGSVRNTRPSHWKPRSKHFRK